MISILCEKDLIKTGLAAYGGYKLSQTPEAKEVFKRIRKGVKAAIEQTKDWERT